MNTSQQIGGALGLAVLVAVSTARTDAVDAAQRVALTEGFQAGLLGGAALALLGPCRMTHGYLRRLGVIGERDRSGPG